MILSDSAGFLIEALETTVKALIGACILAGVTIVVLITLLIYVILK